jgi:hypothetical protein
MMHYDALPSSHDPPGDIAATYPELPPEGIWYFTAYLHGNHEYFAQLLMGSYWEILLEEGSVLEEG